MRTVLIALLAVLAATPALAAAEPHNVIIFVADGLRSGIVSPQSAPAIAALRAEGVDFRESHSVYPSVTTPNAAAIATGHKPGDTGDFGNTVFSGAPALPSAAPSLLLGFENDVALGAMNDRFNGDYMGHETFLALARAAGYTTAAIGKLGPTAIQDITARHGAANTIVIDDNTGNTTGTAAGIPLSPDILNAIVAAGLTPQPPARGDNAKTGDAFTPGATSANVVQQAWFLDVAAKVLLPRFKTAGKPFALVFWSRDPDGTQHNQGDSLNSLTPGINGPTSMAGIRNADDGLARLRATLKTLGLDKTTDVVVTADHGFSTISKQSKDSAAARFRFLDVQPGFLPPGFLAVDLSLALALPLRNPDGSVVSPGEGAHPTTVGAVKNSGTLGVDPSAPEVVVGANGGSDLIWLPTARAKQWAEKIIGFLTTQDYTGALFVDDALGPIPGALPMSAVGLVGDARTPRPAIYVSFRSTPGDCANPEICSLGIADTELQQGQGNHGSFSRADTHNFMAATGPDFKKAFLDPAPVGNADWVPTLAKALGVDFPEGGSVPGRVMSEALVGGRPVAFEDHITRSAPAANGFVTVLNWRSVGTTAYYDAAGAPGRAVGLRP